MLIRYRQRIKDESEEKEMNDNGEQTKATEINAEQSVETAKQDNAGEKKDNNTPTIEELMAELAKEKAEKQRMKKSLDKETSKNADLTKSLRAKQTDEERLAAEREEIERQAKEENEAMRDELNRMKAEKAYKSIDDEKTVNLLIDAVKDGDHDAIAAIIEAEKKKVATETESKINDEWMAKRPQVNAGIDGETPMSVDEIMAVSDPVERHKLIAQNKQLFN